MLRIAIVTLFPEMFQALTDYGVTGRAVKQGLLALEFWSPREFARDKHQTVDDRPYGGGPGMLMMVQPLEDAISAAKEWVSEDAQVVYLSPQGQLLTQSLVQALVGRVPGSSDAKPGDTEPGNLVLLCGRYEGIDERVLQSLVDVEISIGDYVLSGGELPAMVLLDALIRWLPGALGHSSSAAQDSFSNGLLDCPHYTRPEDYRGQRVPEVLLSGNHERIRLWRLEQSLKRTAQRRPDLLEATELTDEQAQVLARLSRQPGS